MAYTNESIASRIAWCQQQKTQSSVPLDLEAWHAEEEGLWDALLNRDHTKQYQQGPPGVFERHTLEKGAPRHAWRPADGRCSGQ